MKRKVIAVTGGIGSGKSAVISILQNAGYNTLDCDELARGVSLRPEVAEEVRSLLGDGYVSNGKLNRRAIRDRVFSDSELLARYNAIFSERTRLLLTERLQEYSGCVFVEISVFDAFDFSWDEVWLVTSSASERKRRVMERDGVTAKSAEDVMSRQNVCACYTLTIENDGDLASLKDNVLRASKLTSEGWFHG